MKYAVLYRLGFTPRERYGRAAAPSVAEQLDREEAATTGLGWPMSATSPQWYRLGLTA